jgi:hypothetical protein
MLAVSAASCDNGSAPDPVDTESLTEEAAVTITGTPKVGETLTAVVTGIDGTLHFAWTRQGAAIGTDADIYIPVTADIGKTLRVEVSSDGAEGSWLSGPVGHVVPADGSVNITGTAKVGETLTAVSTALKARPPTNGGAAIRRLPGRQARHIPLPPKTKGQSSPSLLLLTAGRRPPQLALSCRCFPPLRELSPSPARRGRGNF